jgi:hypothetical protein
MFFLILNSSYIACQKLPTSTCLMRRLKANLKYPLLLVVKLLKTKEAIAAGSVVISFFADRKRFLILLLHWQLESTYLFFL